MRVLLVKELNGTFKPAYNSDYDRIKKLKAGEILDCNIKQSRNVKFLRKFFALLDLVYQNQEIYTNKEHLRHDLIVSAGYYDVWHDYNGEQQIRAKSISFSSMSEDDFGKLYSKVLDKVIDIFSFDRQDIIRNLESFM